MVCIFTEFPCPFLTAWFPIRFRIWSILTGSLYTESFLNIFAVQDLTQRKNCASAVEINGVSSHPAALCTYLWFSNKWTVKSSLEFKHRTKHEKFCSWLKLSVTKSRSSYIAHKKHINTFLQFTLIFKLHSVLSFRAQNNSSILRYTSF
jgi:hypothetical protein